jgi:uncharacterized C2H2 Zn-finger protein
LRITKHANSGLRKGQPPFWCGECNSIWQPKHEHTDKAHLFEVLRDFPKYGTTKKLCPKCVKINDD